MFPEPENRWLYLGANTDSKRFLLFLMEMYLNTEVFTKAAKASIPTIFQSDEGQKIVAEHIGVVGVKAGLKGLVNEDADKFKKLCGITGRRRLVEAAYYSFIGFNMLLMCCLLVGISFAYHVGTLEANYEPIRW